MIVRLLGATLLVAWLAAGCALMAGRQERREAEVVGKRLVTAGFRPVPADTAGKRAHLEAMPKLLFSSTTTKRGQKRYLLADPYRCRCLYVGDEAAYQRYTNLELAHGENTSAAAARRDDRLAGVNDVAPDLSAFEADIEISGAE